MKSCLVPASGHKRPNYLSMDKTEGGSVTIANPDIENDSFDDDDEEDEEEVGMTSKTLRQEADQASTAASLTACIEEPSQPASSDTTTGLTVNTTTGGGGGGAGNGNGGNGGQASGRKEATESTSLVNLTAVAQGTQVQHMVSSRETMEAKRERKAAKTLVIITGVFVVCWLPFFVAALVMPICGDSCYLPDIVSSVFLWLGYVNSMINPIIYTIFSTDFRAAFKKILFGRRFGNHAHHHPGSSAAAANHVAKRNRPVAHV